MSPEEEVSKKKEEVKEAENTMSPRPPEPDMQMQQTKEKVLSGICDVIRNGEESRLDREEKKKSWREFVQW
jgi:hypothetical protein